MKKIINSENIFSVYDFDKFEDCRHFLLNLYIGQERVQGITLSDGHVVKMEDIPDDQIIQRANELASWVKGRN